MGEWLRVEEKYRPVFRRLGLDNLEALLGGPGQRVRHSLHTDTYRLELPAAPGVPGALYVKAYREEWPNPRYLLRPSRALREWRVLRGLRRRGIPAARPVAVGERRRFGALLDAVVVTEEVPGSTDLEQFLPAFLSRPPLSAWRREKRAGLEALARFTRAMHDAGYVSRDFHRRNILIAPHAVRCPAGLPLGERVPAEGGRGVRATPLTLSSAEDGPRFAIIDNPRGLLLPCAALARWLGVRDLAALDRGASAYFSRTDRLSFLRAYARRPLRKCRRLLRRVSARASARTRGQAGVRREPVGPVSLVREGKCWAVFRAPNPLGWAPGPENATQPEALSPAMLLHAGRENMAGCLREWKRASLFPLSAGYGPLGREWQNLRALEGLGLTVPRWLAFAQERAWGFARREVLAVRALPDVEPLERWLERSGVHAWRLRRALAEALGGEIGRAHAGGFCFRKFSVQDVGVRSSTSGGLSAAPAQVPVVPSPLTISPGERAGVRGAVVEPVFLRVGAGQRQRRLSRRKRTRDLVSLGACFPGQLRATEMLCFFRGYLGRRLTRGDKELVRGVLARYLKVARRGRRASAGTPPARASQGSTGEKR